MPFSLGQKGQSLWKGSTKSVDVEAEIKASCHVWALAGTAVALAARATVGGLEEMMSAELSAKPLSSEGMGHRTIGLLLARQPPCEAPVLTVGHFWSFLLAEDLQSAGADFSISSDVGRSFLDRGLLSLAPLGLPSFL